MKKKFPVVPQTTANLAISGVFTGASIDLDTYNDTITGFPYTKISVMAFANQASASNGFTVQFSNDNTNWFTAARATTTASVPSILETPIVGRYVRVVYTNSTTATTSFFISLGIL